MTSLLDIELLRDLYPDPQARCRFLRRAHDVLRADRQALQAAMARRDHGDARQLAHRLQGTAAFLNGARESTLELFRALNQALAQGDVALLPGRCEPTLTYLSSLEAALLRATEDRATTGRKKKEMTN
ncbi:hypothetical protein [Achromobacter aloeverae]|uniref:HPt domain-containing protein n=1 Tax=Achromobacter aloeverae TaxID=1750518 RepID=A0A4Q1HPK9_9BURK|nr:hypothetical protein [Achromobacter aloeverae]RXN92849.1 hypothetical protein C7R54_03670 [Achromobacter aloeverae]